MKMVFSEDEIYVMRRVANMLDGAIAHGDGDDWLYKNDDEKLLEQPAVAAREKAARGVRDMMLALAEMEAIAPVQRGKKASKERSTTR